MKELMKLLIAFLHLKEGNLIVHEGCSLLSDKGGVGMDRENLKQFIAQTYETDAEFPWVKDPDSMVFRHKNNRKWFALIMNVTKDKLGVSDDGVLDILNVKCEPAMIGSLLAQTGFYPAYHMNKGNWISVALDGSVEDEKIKMLLDMSFGLTAPKLKKA